MANWRRYMDVFARRRGTDGSGYSNPDGGWRERLDASRRVPGRQSCCDSRRTADGPPQTMDRKTGKKTQANPPSCPLQRVGRQVRHLRQRLDWPRVRRMVIWLEGLWGVRSSPGERRLKARPQTGQPRNGRVAAGFAARRSLWRWKLSPDVMEDPGFKVAEVLIGGIGEAGAPGIRGDGRAGGRQGRAFGGCAQPGACAVRAATARPGKPPR